MSKVLTVVVPSFNSEKTIRTTLDSLVVVSADLIELLVINDGSTDMTKVIAEDYSKRYPDVVRVITKLNGGHGSGINVGIREAKGKFFKVIDSDDWVDKDSFIALVDLLSKSDVDVVYSGFLWAFDNGSGDESTFRTQAQYCEPFSDVEYGKIYSFEQIADKLYMKFHNLTFKTAILQANGIELDEKCYYEDTEYVLYPIPYVETILFLKEFVYMYRMGTKTQSMSKDKLIKHCSDYTKVLQSNLAYYQKHKDLCSEKKNRYMETMIASYYTSYIKILLLKPLSAKNRREMKQFDDYLKENYSAIYISNSNMVVKILRNTGFFAYYLGWIMIRITKKYH